MSTAPARTHLSSEPNLKEEIIMRKTFTATVILVATIAISAPAAVAAPAPRPNRPAVAEAAREEHLLTPVFRFIAKIKKFVVSTNADPSVPIP